MPSVPVVENPRRRRRRRRTYTAKQRAFGFGGRRRRTTRRRRRNPALAALANPRRRRRYFRAPAHRRRRRYRNAGFKLGGLGGVFKRFDLPAAGWTMGGLLGTRMLPGIASRWFPAIPTMGPMGILTKAATVAVAGMLVGNFVNQRAAQYVVNGGLAAVALELWDQYLGPQFGLSGFVSTDELYKVTGMGGFVPAPPVIDGLGYGAGYDPGTLSA